MSISRESNGRPKFNWNSPLFSIACSIDAGKDITIMPASEATSIHSWGFGPHYGSFFVLGVPEKPQFHYEIFMQAQLRRYLTRYPLGPRQKLKFITNESEVAGSPVSFHGQTTVHSGSSSFQPFPSLVKTS